MANVWEKQHSSRVNTASTISTTTASQQSSAFASQTHQVRLAANQATYVKFAGNPTATTSDVLMPANTIDYFTVNPGEKVAVLALSTTGIISIVEMT